MNKFKRYGIPNDGLGSFSPINGTKLEKTGIIEGRDPKQKLAVLTYSLISEDFVRLVIYA